MIINLCDSLPHCPMDFEYILNVEKCDGRIYNYLNSNCEDESHSKLLQ